MIKSKALKLFALVLCLCMLFSVTAYADTFVPSITSKGSPDVVDAVDINGEDVTDKLVVTPFSRRDTMQDYKRDKMEEAYNAVDPEDLAGTIGSAIGNGTIPLPERWGDTAPEITPDKLSVTDVFYIHEENDRGIVELSATVTLQTTVPDNQLLVVMFYNGSEWVTIPFERLENGKVAITVDEYGPYMIVTNTVNETGGSRNPGNAPGSPQTGAGDGFAAGPFIIIAAAGVCAMICPVLMKVRRSAAFKSEKDRWEDHES